MVVVRHIIANFHMGFGWPALARVSMCSSSHAGLAQYRFMVADMCLGVTQSHSCPHRKMLCDCRFKQPEIHCAPGHHTPGINNTTSLLAAGIWVTGTSASLFTFLKASNS